MIFNWLTSSPVLSKKPYSIFDVEITNSDEMLKLIDIAISSGLELNHLNQNQLLQEILQVLPVVGASLFLK